jgi:hypothetical protein
MSIRIAHVGVNYERRALSPFDESHRSERLAAAAFVAVEEVDGHKSSALGIGTAFVPVFAGGAAAAALRGFARGVPVAGFRGFPR